jgi:hypothetical protein
MSQVEFYFSFLKSSSWSPESMTLARLLLERRDALVKPDDFIRAIYKMTVNNLWGG